MFPTISETAVGSMVPSKMAVQTVKLVTHSEETVLVFVVDGEPLFVDNDSCIFPTGQDISYLHICPASRDLISSWRFLIQFVCGTIYLQFLC